MKKIILMLSAIVCFMGAYVSAQMLDTMGTIAIDGAVTAKGVRDISKGLNLVQQNEIINRINLLAMDIKTSGNYNGLTKQRFAYDFGQYDWNVGAINDTQFYIELKNVDKSSCNKFVKAIKEAVIIKVNSVTKKDCDDKNNIQFIFN